MSLLSGIVADIQRCSFHDGGGIRTSVFLKGCNMRCAWCHNPETIAKGPQILVDESKCIGCGKCEEGCYAGARTPCGVEMTVEDVVKVVMLDAPYYGFTGGVTITGGEVTVQAEFTLAILSACHEKGIHTAVETNMLSSWTNLKPMLETVDLIMADLKVFENEAHKKWTGVENTLIKENLLKASKLNIPLILRTPVIKEVNDNCEELGKIASFAASLPSLMYYELLPYHSLGLSKGKIENSSFTVTEFEKMSITRVEELARAIKSLCPNIRVAGRLV